MTRRYIVRYDKAKGCYRAFDLLVSEFVDGQPKGATRHGVAVHTMGGSKQAVAMKCDRLNEAAGDDGWVQ